MKISEIINLTDLKILRMNENQLKSVVKEISKYTKRRVNILKKVNYFTPALRGFMESGGVINVDAKGVNNLRKELYRGRQFLSAKTSTKTGADKVVKETYKRIGLSKNFPVNAFFRIWEKLIETRPEYGTKGTSQRIQEELAVFINSYTKNVKRESFFNSITADLLKLQKINSKETKDSNDYRDMQNIEADIVALFTDYMDGAPHSVVARENDKIKQRGSNIPYELRDILSRKRK